MKEDPKKKKNVDFTWPAIVFSFAVFGTIGHFLTYNFISQFVGNTPVLIFIINGAIGETLLLSYVALENNSKKKNKENKGLSNAFSGINTFFKILEYLLHRLALILGLSIFLGAGLSLVFEKNVDSSSLFYFGISSAIVVIFFIVRYFTNDDHSTIW